MRFNFRIKFRNITFYLMISQTQGTEGITSSLGNGKHFLLWDFEGYNYLGDIVESLQKVSDKYDLDSIFILSDKEGSYRAWSFEDRYFKEYLKILLDTDYLDWLFFQYTVKRGEATLRTGKKINRELQEVVYVINHNPEWVNKIPDRVKHVYYETNSDGRVYNMMIGDKD